MTAAAAAARKLRPGRLPGPLLEGVVARLGQPGVSVPCLRPTGWRRWPPGGCGGARGPARCSTSPGSAGCRSCAAGRAGQGASRAPWRAGPVGSATPLGSGGQIGRGAGGMFKGHPQLGGHLLLLSSSIILEAGPLNAFISAVTSSHQRGGLRFRTEGATRASPTLKAGG